MSPAIINEGSPLPQEASVTAPAPFSLVGKTIVVTGGGRGLGITLAAAVVEAGGHVACLDILPEPAALEWEHLRVSAKTRGVTVTYSKCDVTAETEVEMALRVVADNAAAQGTEFSGVIACAGIQQKVPAVDYPAADFERVLRVNTTGVFITAKHAARMFIANGTNGSIVLISSMSGQIANRGLTCTAYNSSKAAVQQMCRSLAQEWGQYGIRVNTLSPGVSAPSACPSAAPSRRRSCPKLTHRSTSELL